MPVRTQIESDVEFTRDGLWALLYDPVACDGYATGVPVPTITPAYTQITPWISMQRFYLMGSYLWFQTAGGLDKILSLQLRVRASMATPPAVALTKAVSYGTAPGEMIAMHYVSGWSGTIADSWVSVWAFATTGVDAQIRAIITGKTY